MFVAGTLAQAVAERTTDLFSPDVPWSQKLWRSSAVDALRHCIELVSSGGREKSTAWAIEAARTSLRIDLFVPAAERGMLLKSLALKPEKLSPGSASFLRLVEVEKYLAENYWAWLLKFLENVDDNQTVALSGINADRLAWQLGTHLRAVGLSDRWIVNFVNYHLKYESKVQSLAEVFEDAKSVSESGVGWTFLVPLSRRRGFNVNVAPLLSPEDFRVRFASRFPGIAVPSHRGGFEFSAQTIDKYSAIEAVERDLQAIIIRHRAAGGVRKFVPQLDAWVMPGAWHTKINLSPEPRVRFPALDADGGSRLFESLSDELEAALDLLIAGDRTSVRAASIAAWAVLETLFADESDFGALAAVADRAADVLTCVYARDAFLSLATGHARAATDSLATDLRKASQAEKAVMIESAIATRDLEVGATLGAVALQRARGLDAHEVVAIRDQLATSLRRLYDVRNQIVHAGKVAPYGMNATYLHSTVLLSALLNEIIEKNRGAGVSARSLAGRASWLMLQVSEGQATPAVLASL